MTLRNGAASKSALQQVEVERLPEPVGAGVRDPAVRCDPRLGDGRARRVVLVEQRRHSA